MDRRAAAAHLGSFYNENDPNEFLFSQQTPRGGRCGSAKFGTQTAWKFVAESPETPPWQMYILARSMIASSPKPKLRVR
jgi:hypothetical protein